MRPPLRIAPLHALSVALALGVGLAATACGTAAEPPAPRDHFAGASGSTGTAGTSPTPPGAGGTSAAAGASGSTPSGGTAGAAPPPPLPTPSVGIAVIDVQESFVASARTPDMPAVVERTKAAFELASARAVPLLVTFEDSQVGDHALHAPLAPVLPAHAELFTKTTFAATGLAAFHARVAGSGLSHVVVLGAETDVCVLQTVLGLRRMGLGVVLQKDATFTSETNASPALRRMEQAGVVLADEAAVRAFVEDPASLPPAPGVPVRGLEPLGVGVVLNAFTTATVASTADALVSEKSARLRELLYVSEWFGLPVYVSDVAAGLPATFAGYYQGQLRSASELLGASAVSHLVVAGTAAGVDTAIGSWLASREVFVMEDALIGTGTLADQRAQLAPHYATGLVPLTYKSFYYEMTRSVSLAEWPSQSWLDRYDHFYDLTQAPEDLPAIFGG